MYYMKTLLYAHIDSFMRPILLLLGSKTTGEKTLATCRSIRGKLNFPRIVGMLSDNRAIGLSCLDIAG